MNVFLTGATGFLGGEILMQLAMRPDVDRIFCLVRAKSQEEAGQRMRKLFEFHGDSYDEDRVIPILGNLTQTGLSDILAANEELRGVNVIVHSAANTSFARMHDEAVEKVNIQGLKEILEWAKTLPDLSCFVYVGTATIIGKDVKGRVVREDESPNLEASHVVKYTYTKMLGELIVQEYLPPEQVLIVRPSILMGDSRPVKPRSYVILWTLAAGNLMRLLPVNPESALDIVSVDYAADAIVRLIFARRRHKVYHVSSGVQCATTPRLLTDAVNHKQNGRPPFLFVDREMLAQMRHWARGKISEGAEIFQYPQHLKYWDETFPEKIQLRVLLTGLVPYAEFIDLGQIFDNSRLLEDTDIGPSEPAHVYLQRCADVLDKIDVLEGAMDP